MQLFLCLRAVIYGLLIYSTSAFSSASDCRQLVGRSEWSVAVPVCQRAAEGGDADSQFQMGHLYDKGLGTTKNPEAALAWYRRAADGGSWRATTAIALKLANGQGLEQDGAQALRLLDTAEAAGHLVAGCHAANIIRLGLGVRKDLLAAIDRAKLAQRRSVLPFCLHEIGIALLEPEFRGQRDAEAISTLERALALGDIPSATTLALALSDPNIPGRLQLSAAVRYLRRAIEGGDMSALPFVTGRAVATGMNGLPLSDVTIIRNWIDDAAQPFLVARRGNRTALCDKNCYLTLANLAVALHAGYGAPRDEDKLRELARLAPELQVQHPYWGVDPRSNPEWRKKYRFRRNLALVEPGIDVWAAKFPGSAWFQRSYWPKYRGASTPSRELDLSFVAIGGNEEDAQKVEAIASAAAQILGDCGIRLRRVIATVGPGIDRNSRTSQREGRQIDDLSSTASPHVRVYLGPLDVFLDRPHTQGNAPARPVTAPAVNMRATENAERDGFLLAHELGHVLGNMAHMLEPNPSIMSLTNGAYLNTGSFSSHQCARMRDHPLLYSPSELNGDSDIPAFPATPLPRSDLGSLIEVAGPWSDRLKAFRQRDRAKVSADEFAVIAQNAAIELNMAKPFYELSSRYIMTSPRLSLFYSFIAGIRDEFDRVPDWPMDLIDWNLESHPLERAEIVKTFLQARNWRPENGLPTDKMLRDGVGWARVDAKLAATVVPVAEDYIESCTKPNLSERVTRSLYCPPFALLMTDDARVKRGASDNMAKLQEYGFFYSHVLAEHEIEVLLCRLKSLGRETATKFVQRKGIVCKLQ